MTLKYTLNEKVDDNQIYGRFLSNLHDKGISLMDASYSGEPSRKLGMNSRTTTEENLVLSWGSISLDCPSSMYSSEVDALVEELAKHDIDASRTVNIVETVKEEYGVPDSKCVYLSSGENGSHVLTYSTDDGTDVNLSVFIWQDSWSKDDLSVKFEMTWTPSKVQKKQNIEEVLVNKPIRDMGMVQSIVENNLNILRWDGEQPEIDCHFTHNTFSKTECAPDIVKRVRDARKAQDATEEE